MTMEGDLVLVYMDNKPAFFARIEDITADVKPEWFQVKMLVLQVPLMMATWILRDVYINGEEFTMGGRPVRMEKVIPPEEESPEIEEDTPAKSSEEAVQALSDASGKGGKVVSLASRRKKGSS